MSQIRSLPRVTYVVVLTGLLAVALGSASALAVNGGFVQAGGDTDLTCDLNGVSVAYGVAFVAGDFKVTSVTVNGFANNCIGKVVDVTLTQGGAPIASADGVVLVSGPSNNRTTGPLPVTPPPLMTVVDDVHVLVVDDAGP